MKNFPLILCSCMCTEGLLLPYAYTLCHKIKTTDTHHYPLCNDNDDDLDHHYGVEKKIFTKKNMA